MLMYAVAISQPTLTATGINTVIGESFTFNSYASVLVSPGSAGANQTWNLSTMAGTTLAPTTVVTPSSTTYGSSFPNANMAWSTPSSGVSYFKTSSSAMQGYGIVSGTVVMSYSNPEDYLHFPFNYNNTYSDPWATQFQNGGYTFYRSGTTTVTADGYGTLITPAGTYTNVMRVHFVQVYKDSAYIGMPYVITYNNDEYMWYKEGTHYQLATVYTMTSSAGGLYNGGSYATNGTGIEYMQELISSVNVFPNPTSDIVTIDFMLTENKEVHIQLFSPISQQVVVNQNTFGNQGVNAVQFDVSNLSEGIYFARISFDGNIAAARSFVIIK